MIEGTPFTVPQIQRRVASNLGRVQGEMTALSRASGAPEGKVSSSRRLAQQEAVWKAFQAGIEIGQGTKLLVGEMPYVTTINNGVFEVHEGLTFLPDQGNLRDIVEGSDAIPVSRSRWLGY